MKKTSRIILISFLILSLAGFLSAAKAGQENTNCYLEASTDVFVVVWNLDEEGNKGSVIWKGTLKQGDRQLIRTLNGRMRYASTTNIEENTALDGDVDRWCNDGKSIGVP